MESTFFQFPRFGQNLPNLPRRSNILLPRPGKNVVTGTLGNDVLLAGSGNTRLFGEAGDDVLLGGFGNNFLDGGTGNNLLRGGRGRNTFVLKDDGRRDTILDFNPRRDKLFLSDGLTMADLEITQQGRNAVIRYLGQMEPSVTLLGVNARALTPRSFKTPPPVSTFSSLVILGDSLSDPGNLFALTGFFPPAPYSEGRFSNGDIWVDYFTDSLGIDDSQVQNFALGGAATGSTNGLNALISSLVDESVSLPSLPDQVESYLGSLGDGPADPDSLYVLWIGANDLLNLPNNPFAIPGFLTTAVENIANTITTLAERGADKFLVPNLADLGLTPRARTAGTSQLATTLSASFNTSLTAALTALDQDPLLGIDITVVDLFGLTQSLVNNPTEFGFTNVTDSLLNQGGLNNPGFFWWDQQHPTTQGHALLAEIFQDALTAAGYLLPGPVSSALPDLALAGAEPLLAGTSFNSPTFIPMEAVI